MGGFHVDTAELTDAAGMIRSSVDLADGMDMNAAVKGGNAPRPGNHQLRQSLEAATKIARIDLAADVSGVLRSLERGTLTSTDGLEADRYLVLTHPGGEIEWHASERDELILFAYTGIRELAATCGTGQPWVYLDAAEIQALQSSVDTTLLVAVDVWYPDGTRYPPTDPRDREPLAYAKHLTPVTDVWIPALPMASGAKAARVELYAVTPGDPMLLCYRSLDDLHTACGPYQAAISVRADALRQVAEEAGAHGVLFDAELSDELRHTAPVVDWVNRPLWRGLPHA